MKDFTYCVKCNKKIIADDFLIMYNTIWGPIHYECGASYSHTDRFAGELFPKEEKKLSEYTKKKRGFVTQLYSKLGY